MCYSSLQMYETALFLFSFSPSLSPSLCVQQCFLQASVLGFDVSEDFFVGSLSCLCVYVCFLVQLLDVKTLH